MATNVVRGFPQVDLSITNSNVNRSDALDKFAPYSYLEFIQTVSEAYTPDTLVDFYNEYINRWNKKTNAKVDNDKDQVIDRYRDFLRDITLNFTTNAERVYLSEINFENPHDLQIAMSFYSKKIREIITYYKKKRNNLHYTVTKARLKGSSLGADQAATDLIVNFLENRDTSAIDYDINIIKENLNVSLTEYFDNFANYFNRAPDSREYGLNFKAYDPASPPTDNIFLSEDSELIRQVFINLRADIVNLKEPRSLFENKRAQTEKFIGADFYYLSTDSNGVPNRDNNGKPQILFKADKPYANFVNQDFPSTASVFSNDIISERDLGFFRPHNSSIVAIQGKRLEYFTLNEYEPDQLYVFPDPSLYTNTQNILTFIVDTSRSINNRSKGIAVNQPNTDKDSTSFLGYNSEIANNRNLNTDLTFLYDQGYIEDSKKDLFGNIFGLVKDDNYYRSNIDLESPDQIKSLVVNGYQFFDDLYGEGFGFNYETTDTSTFSETIRSGLTSFTNGLSGMGASAPELPLSTYNLFFRYFSPYQHLKDPANYLQVDYDRPENIEVVADVKEGAYFVFNDDETLADPVRSGLSSYDASTAQFYFSDLIDAGIGSRTNVHPPSGGVIFVGSGSIFRALSDDTSAWSRSLSGDFTLDVRLSAGNGIENYDARYFNENIVYKYEEASDSYPYNDTVYFPTSFNTTTTAVESFFDKQENVVGKIYIKNSSIADDTPSVKELTETLTYISGKYSSTICDELSTSVNNFDIFYDTLFIQTSSFLVIEKTLYKDNTFITPRTFTNSLAINTNNLDKVSNRLKVNNDVFYCRMASTQNTGQAFSNIIFYPEIYKYSYINEKVTQVFPTTVNPVVSSSLYFNLSTVDNVYVESGIPVLTYSSDNEQFNLAVLLKDQNKGPLLVNYLFEYKDTVKFLNSETFVNTSSKNTSDFVSVSGTLDIFTLSKPLSSQIPNLEVDRTNYSTGLSAANLIL